MSHTSNIARTMTERELVNAIHTISEQLAYCDGETLPSADDYQMASDRNVYSAELNARRNMRQSI